MVVVRQRAYTEVGWSLYVGGRTLLGGREGVIVVRRGTYTGGEEGGAGRCTLRRVHCVLYAFYLGLAGLTRVVK